MGVPVRQLLQRLRTCEAGSGLVEYGLLIAVIALGLVGVLALFRNSVGGITNRTADKVSMQAGSGYGIVGTGSTASSGGSAALGPGPSDPDSAAAVPDSASAA